MTLNDNPATASGRRSAVGAPVISLFSGAGGLDLGVADAGGDIRACVEVDADCVSTLRANATFFPNTEIIAEPIQTVPTEAILAAARLRRGEAALLVGGPPCQPFSKAGYWLQERRKGIRDERANFLAEYLRVLDEARPEAFILENVPSLLHPSHRELFDLLVTKARALGYAVNPKVLHAPEYGVPQSRSRVFVVGLRGEHPPELPRPTHWWHSPDSSAKLEQPETAGRWIAHLDKPEFHEPEEVAQGRWEAQLREIPPGENYKHLTAWAGHPSPTFITETKYWSFLLKLSPHRPSWTIQATPGPWTGPFHWSSRRLRVPELAALQTFPASYVFTGRRRARMRQIGNAVPCVLASHVAAAILSDVNGANAERGKVLTFQLSDEFPFREALLAHRGHRW